MAISVVLKDRTGEVLAQMPRPYVPLVSWADRTEYPILGHVDLYGNTIYNRAQMETLVAELDRLRQLLAEPDERARAIVDGLQEVCAEGVRNPHRYLWFVGD
jgi:hypothetical protein